METFKLISINGFKLMSGNFYCFRRIIANSTNETGKKSVFFHINLFNYYSLLRRTNLRELIFKNSNLILDGIAMKTACFLMGKGIVKDINGTDLFPFLMDELEHRHKTIYLLGADKITLNNALVHIRQNYPKAVISGYHHGYFDETEESGLVDEINKSNPDMLIISMGILNEAEFVNRNFGRINVKSIWNVGGLFDFISGNKPRAPKWIRKARFEWFYRFIIEPKRLFFRYFILAWWFIIHIIKIMFRNTKPIL